MCRLSEIRLDLGSDETWEGTVERHVPIPAADVPRPLTHVCWKCTSLRLYTPNGPSLIQIYSEVGGAGACPSKVHRKALHWRPARLVDQRR